MYIAHSINRERDGYNSTFTFINTSVYSAHSIFNSYILWLGERALTRFSLTAQMIFLFTIYRYLRKKREDLAYFLLNISIVFLFALNEQMRGFFPFLISYLWIIHLSIGLHCDLKNPLNDLKVYNKKYFFSSE